MMKNRISLTIFLLTALFSFAQPEKGDVELSPFLGMNFSTISINTDTPQQYETTSQLAAGGTLDYYFSDTWSFRTGLIYDSKGGENQIEEISLNYLTIPLQANWHFGRTKRWYLNFGVAAAFYLNGEVEFDGQTLELDEAANSFDFGLGLGIGHKFPIDEATYFFIDYQVMASVTPFLELPVDGLNQDVGFFNSRGSINLGVAFTLDKPSGEEGQSARD